MKTIGSLLIALALMAGMLSCSEVAVSYELTVSSTSGGSVVEPGEGVHIYEEGTVVDLVAEPDTGHRFVDWTGDVGTVSSVTAASTTMTMNGDYSITANFEETPAIQYELTISSTAGGSVTTPGEGTFTYDDGTAVNLVATPVSGYRFVNWTGDVATITDPNAAATTISMGGDYSITAGFELERTGPLLDEVVITTEPDPSTAVQKLKDDVLDVYAFGLVDPALYAEVLTDPSLTSVFNVHGFDELTFNPVGPTFPATGKLNPFSDPQFREAMHWLIDRDYIAGDVLGGLAVPRYTCLDPQGADASERFPDIVADLVAKYGHNPVKAATVIAERMEALDASLVDGKWHYNGEPVELIGLIRTDDERKDIGDYFADLLEGQGFLVERLYSPSLEDSQQIWQWRDPAEGLFHFYTGGWGSTVIRRNQANDFGAFYTNLWSAAGPLWQAYENDPDFYEAAEKLWNGDFATMEERAGHFELCLPKSMEDNVRMFLINDRAYSPMRSNVRVAHDYAGGLSGGQFVYYPAASNTTWGSPLGGSWAWALTAHVVDGEGQPIVGGSLRTAMPDLLVSPWNPVAGSNSVYDMFPVKATGDRGLQPDTRTGLRWPGRIEKAEVFAEPGVPMSVTNTDWCTLTFVPEIQVPLDAWADWDAVNQRFLTVEDRFGAEGTTAKTKSVSYYPEEIFEIPLHDGSTLSMSDFIIYTILQFDRAKPGSAMYDESAVAVYNDFMSHFKGVRFITDDPDYGMIVEYYSDRWQLDAELVVNTMFSYYSQGPGMWHTIALGIQAEEDGALAFSGHKAGTLGVPWMDFIDGASLPILKSYLDSAKATNYISYEPTMGLYVTEAEAIERWSNLDQWYSGKGHFWVGSGPFYLGSVDINEKIIRLKRFEDYPDPMDRWLFLLEPLP